MLCQIAMLIISCESKLLLIKAFMLHSADILNLSHSYCCEILFNITLKEITVTFNCFYLKLPMMET